MISHAYPARWCETTTPHDQHVWVGDGRGYACFGRSVVMNCPACGYPNESCPGHPIGGDPLGWATLRQHDVDSHRTCHPAGCEKSTLGIDRF